MSYVMDEYFENLVQQLRTGKLSSGELIQKIDKSELNGLQSKGHLLSPRAASSPERKDNPSFEELCQQAEMLLSNSPILQKPNAKHFNLATTSPAPNKFHNEAISENTQHMKTLHRSPAFINEPYLYLSRDPLEEIGNINVQPDKLSQTLGKKQFDDEEIEKIRERTAQKRLEKALLLKQQSLMKDFIEYETHCKFQPQINSTQNKDVKSKYMAAPEQKIPTDKLNSKSENFTFRPQTTEYKPNSKTKEYLEQNAFSRLSSTSTACQLSSRFASQVTLLPDALLQHKKSNSPTPTCSSLVSRVQSLQKLSKTPSNLNFTGEKPSDKEIFQKAESIKTSPLNRNKTRNFEGNTFGNEFETRENFNSKEGEQITSSAKKALHKINQEFLERQETFEWAKKDRISKISKSVAAVHSPQIEEGSKKILQKKFGESSNFESRSRYFQTKKKLKLEDLKKTCGPTFQPEISQYARSLSREKVCKARMNSQKKAELTKKNVRRDKNMKECSELIFHPEINTKFVTESRLGLEKPFKDYVQDLRCKEQLVRNFKEVLDRRRELQETIECTHQPQINEFPNYLNQQKGSFETQLKNKAELLGDKYTSIQKRTRSTGSKPSVQSEIIVEKLFETRTNNTMLENQEKIDTGNRSLTTKSEGKQEDHTLTLTSEDLFSRSYQVIGDDEDIRSRNIVEEERMRSDLDRLQISEVLSPHVLNFDKKVLELEPTPRQLTNEGGNMNSPRLPEVDASSFYSFPTSPSQQGSGSGRKPPLHSLWKRN